MGMTANKSLNFPALKEKKQGRWRSCFLGAEQGSHRMRCQLYARRLSGYGIPTRAPNRERIAILTNHLAAQVA
jgi:hypothetical protein